MRNLKNILFVLFINSLILSIANAQSNDNDAPASPLEFTYCVAENVSICQLKPGNENCYDQALEFCKEKKVFEFAVFGDAGSTNANVQSVRQSIQRSGVESLVMLGDNNYEDSATNRNLPLAQKLSIYDKIWSSWTDLLFSIVAIGNHNLGYDAELIYFNSREPKNKLSENYSRSFGRKTKFIVLNSDNEYTVDQQMAWLTNEVETSDKPFTFLVYHHPSYTAHFAHFSSEKIEFQRKIRPLLQKYKGKIKAVFLGHDHIAAAMGFGDVKAYVSGATKDFRISFGLNYKALDGVSVKTKFLKSDQPYWLKLTVDESNDVAEVNFIRSRDDQPVYKEIL